MARARRNAAEDIGDLPMLLDARRRRAARRPNVRPWADRFERGSIEELRHALKFAAEDFAAGCEHALTVCRILDAAIKAREAVGTDVERFLKIAGVR